MRLLPSRPASPSTLRLQGLLGINARNSAFVLPHNERSKYPRLDDKLLTKTVCEAQGIPVPETYAVIERYGDVRNLESILGDRPDFVVKPCKGAEGRGVLVIAPPDWGRSPAEGVNHSIASLRYHVSTILSGLYSLGGQCDRAIVEQRIVCHPVLDPISVGGTPDVRVILYRGVPAMAMVRLPTRSSSGRANLHQGAVAAGVHLATGRTFGGVCRNRIVSRHPDTGIPISGFRIPGWKQLLRSAIALGDALEMGYLGIDFVIDASLGPVVLEANARPGLSIQIANRRGLLRRLQWIDQHAQNWTLDWRMEALRTLATL